MEFITNIRQASHALHSASEHTGYIKRIMTKTATKEGYGEYLYNLSAMYKAIEDSLEKNSDNPIVKDFITKELYRYELIQKDIKHLLGDKASSMTLLASTVSCIARINELATTKPELIVAYAYTRFLADLFGGRLFYELFSKEYKIEDEGLNYYKFEGIDDMRGYAMGYGARLSGINISDDLKTEFINEVNNAYIYNLAISNELEIKLHPHVNANAQHPHQGNHPHGPHHGHPHAGHPGSGGHPHHK